MAQLKDGHGGHLYVQQFKSKVSEDCIFIIDSFLFLLMIIHRKKNSTDFPVNIRGTIE